MALDDLKARLESLFADYRKRPDQRAYTSGLQDALVDLKLGLDDLRKALGGSEQELMAERGRLDDAERRGRLAEGIRDQDTVAIAKEFADKHRVRIELLERKVAVQRDEVRLAEVEYEDLSNRFRSARQGVPPTETEPPAGPPAEDSDLLKSRIDTKARQAAVEAQLEMLKRKMGRG
ncbi:MAG: hypothetical protein ABI647_00160 [Gemmatimonadota bacterium]